MVMRSPGCQLNFCAIDRLAMETLKTAGAVYAVARSEIPGEAVAAAVMRY